MQWDYFVIFICKWYFAANLLLAILKLNIFSYGYGFILSWPIIKQLDSSYAFSAAQVKNHVLIGQR